jgi:hypothetical protein
MKRHLLLMFCAATAGCGATLQATTPRWDQQAGEMSRAAFAQQVLDPDAGRRRDANPAQDGRSAAAAQIRYQKSYAAPVAPPSAFTIGVAESK